LFVVPFVRCCSLFLFVVLLRFVVDRFCVAFVVAVRCSLLFLRSFPFLRSFDFFVAVVLRYVVVTFRSYVPRSVRLRCVALFVLRCSFIPTLFVVHFVFLSFVRCVTLVALLRVVYLVSGSHVVVVVTFSHVVVVVRSSFYTFGCICYVAFVRLRSFVRSTFVAGAFGCVSFITFALLCVRCSYVCLRSVSFAFVRAFAFVAVVPFDLLIYCSVVVWFVPFFVITFVPG